MTCFGLFNIGADGVVRRRRYCDKLVTVYVGAYMLVCEYVGLGVHSPSESLETWHSSSPGHNDFGFKRSWVRVRVRVRGRRRLASPDSAHYLLVQLLLSMLSSISPSPLHRHTSGVEARPFCVMLLGFRYRMPSTCTESVWRIADVLRVVRGVKPFSNGLWRSLIRDNGVIEYCHAQPIDLNDYVGLTGKVII